MKMILFIETIGFNDEYLIDSTKIVYFALTTNYIAFLRKQYESYKFDK